MSILTEIRKIKEYADAGSRVLFDRACAAKNISATVAQGFINSEKYKISHTVPVIEESLEKNDFNSIVNCMENWDVDEFILTANQGSYIFTAANKFKYYGFSLEATTIETNEGKEVEAFYFYKYM